MKKFVTTTLIGLGLGIFVLGNIHQSFLLFVLGGTMFGISLESLIEQKFKELKNG